MVSGKGLGWVLMPKWEGLRSKNKYFALYVLQNMSFLGVVKCIVVKYIQEVPVTIKTDYFGPIRSEFLRICNVLEKGVFPSTYVEGLLFFWP